MIHTPRKWGQMADASGKAIGFCAPVVQHIFCTTNVHTQCIHFDETIEMKTCISKYVRRLCMAMYVCVCMSVLSSLLISTFSILFQFGKWHVQNPFDVKMKMTTS